MNNYLCKKYLPHVKICHRILEGNKCKVAQHFMEAAIHFMTEAFMTQEEILSQPEKNFFDDVSVNHAFVMNSSIWIIGPYIPEDVSGKACQKRLYYRIAAGVCFRTTTTGSYIEFIRSLSSSADDTLMTSPWNISFLNSSRNNMNKFINRRRMGVLLMCVIQELCIASEMNSNLYLQTSYENSSYQWFITIGFSYAANHYGPIVDIDAVPMCGYPLCSDPENELPKPMGSLAKKGELTYSGTFDEDTSPESQMVIRLLCLEKRLCEWFPPTSPITNHSFLMEWLYSVPFPPPSKKTSWIQKSGKPSLIRHVESLIPRSCFVKDTDWSMEENESGINELKKKYSFNISIKEKEYFTLRKDNTTSQANSKLLNLSMPFVDVQDLEYDSNTPDHHTWFFAVLVTLYGEFARFTGEELKLCLVAFWHRHRLLNPKLKFMKMWNWNMKVGGGSSMKWKDVCTYWNNECHKLMHSEEPRIQ